MKVNDVIKTKSGSLFTVQRAEKFGAENREYLLLYEVQTGDLAFGYTDDGKLKFVNDPARQRELAELFDKAAKN